MLSPGSVTNAVPDPDEIARNVRDVQRNLQEQASARSGERMQIGSGGILINSGGSLTIAGTGALNVGTGALNSAGSISAATTLQAGTGISTSSGDVTAPAGSMSAAGSITAQGIVNGVGGFQSVDARNWILTAGSYAAIWADGTGRFGQSPSSLRFKRDIVPAIIDTAGILALEPIDYRLIAAVEEFGDDARVETGLPAEDVVKVAPWAVYYDVDGRVQGINYDRLSVALLAIVKIQHSQITDIQTRLNALEDRQD